MAGAGGGEVSVRLMTIFSFPCLPIAAAEVSGFSCLIGAELSEDSDDVQVDAVGVVGDAEKPPNNTNDVDGSVDVELTSAPCGKITSGACAEVAIGGSDDVTWSSIDSG